MFVLNTLNMDVWNVVCCNILCYANQSSEVVNYCLQVELYELDLDTINMGVWNFACCSILCYANIQSQGCLQDTGMCFLLYVAKFAGMECDAFNLDQHLNVGDVFVANQCLFAGQIGM